MPPPFQLAAQLVIHGPDTTKVMASLTRQFKGIKIPLDFDIKTGVAAAKKEINAVAASSAAANKQQQKEQKATTKAIATTNAELTKSVDHWRDFGRASGLAFKRFAGYTIAVSAMYAVTNSITGAVKEAMNFQSQMVKISQVANISLKNLGGLRKEIMNLSQSLGINREGLADISLLLKQAGLSAKDTATALRAIAKTNLAPTFGSMEDTAEGAVAIMNQFKLSANQLEAAFGSLNAVAAAYPVESKDIIEATKIAGGVFAALSDDVGTGLEQFQEFTAVFSSIRSTTRQSAATIATGLKTIFGRMQRPEVVDYLRGLGVELTDLEGKMLAPADAVIKLGDAFNKLSPRDPRIGQLVEKLGGIRQIGKTIPLLMQTDLMKEGLEVARKGVNSLEEDVSVGMQSINRQFVQVRESFKNMIVEFTDTTTFKLLTQTVLSLSKALIEVSRAFKEVMPLIAAFGLYKGFGIGKRTLGGFPGGVMSVTKNVVGRQSGGPTGLLQNGIRGKDTIPLAGKGEFVVRASSVNARTLPVLEALNSGRVSFNVRGTSYRDAKGRFRKPTLLEKEREYAQSINASSMLPKGSGVLAQEQARARSILSGIETTSQQRQAKLREVQEQRRLLQEQRNVRNMIKQIPSSSNSNTQRMFSGFNNAPSVTPMGDYTRQAVVNMMGSLEPIPKQPISYYKTTPLDRFAGSIGGAAKTGWNKGMGYIGGGSRIGGLFPRISGAMDFGSRLTDRMFGFNKMSQFGYGKRTGLARRMLGAGRRGVGGGIRGAWNKIGGLQGMGGMGLMMGGQYLGNAIGGEAGAGISGASTFGGMAAMMGAGPAGIIGAAALGGLSGATNKNIAELQEQAQKNLTKSIKDLNVAFEQFEKDGNLKQLAAVFNNISKSPIVSKFQASAKAEQTGMYGYVLGNSNNDIDDFFESIDRYAMGRKAINQMGIKSYVGNSLITGSATMAKFAPETYSNALEKIKNASLAEDFVIQSDLQEKLNPAAESGNRLLQAYLSKGQGVAQMAASGAGGVTALSDIIMGNADLKNSLENTAFNKIGRLRSVYEQAAPGADADKALAALKQAVLDNFEIIAKDRSVLEFDKNMKKIQASSLQASLALAHTSSKMINLSESFEDLSARLDGVGQSSKNFAEVTRISMATMSGNIALRQNVSSNIFENIRGRSIGELKGGYADLRNTLGNSSVLAKLEDTVITSEQLRRKLPSMLITAQGLPQLENISAKEGMMRMLSKFDFSGPAGKDMYAQAVAMIDKMFGEQSGAKFRDMSAKEIRDFVEGLTDDLKDGGSEATSKFRQKIQEVNNTYIAAVEQQAQIQKDINSKRAGLAAKAAEFENQRIQLFSGRKDLSLQERLNPVQSQLTSLLGGTNQFRVGGRRVLQRFSGNVFNPTDIKNNMAQLEAMRTRLEAERAGRAATGKFESPELNKQLAQVEIALAQNEDALKILSDDTTRLAFVQERMAQLEQQKQAAQSTVMDIAMMGPNEKAMLSRQLAAYAQFKQTGQLQGGMAGQMAIQGGQFLARSGMIPQDQVDAMMVSMVKALFAASGFDPQSDQLRMAAGQTTKTQQQLQNIAIQGNNIQTNAANALINIQQKQVQILAHGSRIALIGGQREIAGAVGHAGGGMIHGNFNGKDNVPAMLMPGEFVVNRRAARENMGVLRAINNGVRMANGGIMDTDFRGLSRINSMSREEQEARLMKHYNYTHGWRYDKNGKLIQRRYHSIPNIMNAARSMEYERIGFKHAQDLGVTLPPRPWATKFMNPKQKAYLEEKYQKRLKYVLSHQQHLHMNNGTSAFRSTTDLGMYQSMTNREEEQISEHPLYFGGVEKIQKAGRKELKQLFNTPHHFTPPQNNAQPANNAGAFNQAVQKLGDQIQQLAKINIPSNIQMSGNHQVEVVINGAAAFNDMKDKFQILILHEINKAFDKRFNMNGEQVA